jgi:ferredoxin-thioredoxin reductase catalytic subunit
MMSDGDDVLKKLEEGEVDLEEEAKSILATLEELFGEDPCPTCDTALDWSEALAKWVCPGCHMAFTWEDLEESKKQKGEP